MTGSPNRLERLLALHGLELARHLRRIVRDDDAAQDLLQDTFLRAQRALDRLDKGANARAWLYRIATNVALNHVRDRARARRAMDAHAREMAAATANGADGAGSGGHDDRADDRRALWLRVAALPERQRVALTLRVADELEYDAIAARMGITQEAARANVYQATKKLRLEVHQ
jgi:RNA polymerase sigma-70 factor (ECF subfamily)